MRFEVIFRLWRNDLNMFILPDSILKGTFWYAFWIHFSNRCKKIAVWANLTRSRKNMVYIEMSFGERCQLFQHLKFLCQVRIFSSNYIILIFGGIHVWYMVIRVIVKRDSVKWPMKKLSKRKRLRWTLKTVDLLGCGSPPPLLTVRKRTAVG